MCLLTYAVVKANPCKKVSADYGIYAVAQELYATNTSMLQCIITNGSATDFASWILIDR